MAATPTPGPQTRSRTRLEPEARQLQLLDCAARLVGQLGLEAVSMERVAAEAGVSKALVYAYFPSRKALLARLLERDLERIQADQMTAAMSAKSFPELVRATTHIALAEIERRGPLVRRLMGEPSLTDAISLVRMKAHETNLRYLARRIAREFDVPMRDALALTDIGLGLTIAAGEMIQRGAARREEIEETTCAMIIGAVRAGAARTRKQT